MKLWLKQTLVTLAVILLSVSVCLYHFVAQETDQLIQQAIQSGARHGGFLRPLVYAGTYVNRL